MLSEAQRRELLGVGLLALTVLLGLSLVPLSLLGEGAEAAFPRGNIMGGLGALFSRWGFRALGAGLPFVVVVPALAGAGCFGWLERETAIRWSALALGLALLVPTGAALIRLDGRDPWLDAVPPGAGWAGVALGAPLSAALGPIGAMIVLGFLFVALSVGTIGWNPARAAAVGGWRAARRLASAVRLPRPPGPAPRRRRREPERPVEPSDEPAPAVAVAPAPPALEEEEEKEKRKKEKKEQRAERGRKAAAEAEPVLEDPGHPGSEDLPPLDLLTPQPPRSSSLSDEELDRLGQVVIDTLRTFKVEGRIGGRTTGPVVTQFEVIPAPGVKVNKIAALDADLALALKAPSVRIVAPIPGKGAVGVEVPNPEPEVVMLRDLLETAAFQRSRGNLPLALGRDLTGKPYVADLARMPHLLIAGATGSGKSVCINTIITSLIYRHTPRSLRLLLIDPKMVELSMYRDLPHLRHPVVTDPKDAATVLKWAVLEMERRYELLSENGARSILEFNRRVEAGQTLRRVQPVGEEGDPDRWIYTDGPLPYIVIVVDELADLMLAVQAEIEKPLAQLAQKARAIGIHLIVATQRPSVNVITGLIKANFPCRIAFRVSSKVDSRTILDQNGADALLGNGDMLFLPPGQSDPVRIQGAFLTTEDTERLMQWYRGRAAERPAAEDDILEVVRALEAEQESEDAELALLEERDPLFRQAAEICIQFRQGSTSLLQRRLRIGYGRAARIIDQLHQAGILGPPDGSKPREVLVGLDALDSLLGE
ncbi:MAG: DNA translocase FtsK [bacterium]|nr:MAG: cell division protein FtsK [bacterium]